MKTGLVALVVAVGIMALLLAKGIALQDRYLRDLRIWGETARYSPEGEATAALFDEAVSAGAIAWGSGSDLLQLRVDPALSQALNARLFDIGENGLTIAREIQAANGLTHYLSVRARRPGCDAQCDELNNWVLSAGPISSDSALRMALAASVSSPTRIMPDPALHAEIARHAGGGYGPWSAWTAFDDVEFRMDAPEVDQIDVIGQLVTATAGWRIEERWCRDAARVLQPCDGSQGVVAASRIHRESPGAVARLTVRPLPIFEGLLPEGMYRVSNWITLRCNSTGACVPSWRRGAPDRRYVRTPRPVGSDGEQQSLPLVPDVLGAWGQVRVGSNGSFAGFAPSDFALQLGAWPVVEQVLPAARALPADAPDRLTLDPEIQRITSEILQELLRVGPTTFSNLGANFPPLRQVSVVVMDLREGRDPGAIRAAVGTPAPDPSYSRWDRDALSYLPSAGVPPGPTAWTGRGRQHIPGSVWKLVTALALIDAAVDPRMVTHRADIERMLDGLTAREADTLLGNGALTAEQGLCAPRTLSDPSRGAAAGSCRNGIGAPIQDSGRGGPLSHPSVARTRYGLVAATARSSNIWFASALLAVERWRQSVGALPDPDPAQPGARLGLAETVRRLGLLEVASLDGDRGLGAGYRDAVEIEAFAPASDPRVLASAAFGQQVQAGPLATALVVGSIRRGEVLRASLLSPVAPADQLFMPDNGAERLLGLLRDGMRATVSGQMVGQTGGVGTAARAFAARAPSLLSRVGGKTGTAEVDDRTRLRISSFGGWLDTPDHNPGLAISCAATLIGQGSASAQENSGLRVVQVCPNLVAELMRRLDAAGLVAP